MNNNWYFVVRQLEFAQIDILLAKEDYLSTAYRHLLFIIVKWPLFGISEYQE